MNNLSFAIIKPEIALYPSLCWFIIGKFFEQKNLNIVDAKWHKFSRPEAEKFYAVHKDRFFYERLVQHISSGNVVALLLAGDNAVQSWRNLMGTTKVFQTVIQEPHSIRGSVGLTDTRNVCHGSDSVENSIKEAKHVFGKLNMDHTGIDCDRKPLNQSQMKKILFEVD